MNETKYVAISTQKGGAGKTTLTVLVASYLHYVKGYNVAVVDCDFPQYSVHDMRKRDLKAIMEDEYYKSMAYEQLKRLEKNPYPIKCSRAEDAIKTAEQLFPVPFLLLVPRAVGDELLTQKLHNDPSEKSVQRESIRCRIR